jgi:hypothetical protein
MESCQEFNEYLKEFLDKVCDDNYYIYHQVENLAEIYKEDENIPTALVEWDYSLGQFKVKFRIGVSSSEVACLTRDMAEVDSCLIFEGDFFIDSEKGYLFGEEATQAFVIGFQKNIEEAQMAQLKGVTYVSNMPIPTPGSEFQGKTKIEKYWGDEL